MFAATGSTITAAIFPACSRENALDGGDIVVGRVEREARERVRNAGARRNAKRREAGAGFDEKTIGVAVVAALEFEDQIALGEGARDADGGHGRFGAGADEADAFDRRDGARDALAQLDFERRRHAVAGAARGLIRDGGDNVGMRVTENQRAPGADVVDVFAAVGVPQARARARSMMSGVPPTARNARTGLFTPPTRIFSARAKRSEDRESGGTVESYYETKACWHTSNGMCTSCKMRSFDCVTRSPKTRGQAQRADCRSGDDQGTWSARHWFQPAGDVLGVIGQDDRGAGALDAGHDFEHDALLVNPAVCAPRL